MAEIPQSTVVRVTIGVAPTFPSRAGFGTLNILGSSNVIPIAERARTYANADGVAADFGADTEERKAANIYFSQNPRPAQLVISRRAAADLPPEVRGGGNPAVLATWTAVTDGSMALTLGTNAEDITAMDFSSATTLPEVAAVIQAAVRAAGASNGVTWTAATVTFESGRFFIRGGQAGDTNIINFPVAVNPATGTDVVALAELGVTDATRQQGIDAESGDTGMTAALDAVQDINQDWYGLAVTKEVRDVQAVIEAAATWVEARVKVFGNDSEDRDILDSINTNDIASVLMARNLNRTLTCYNQGAGEYLAVSALSRAFVVNFNQINSTLTLKFKQMPGITTASLTITQKTALDAKNANALINVGGNPMFAEGFMSNGRFFDEVHGLDWLQNAIETNVFGKLYTDVTKTAMTDPGVASLQQQVEAALDQGRVNGLLAPGFRNDDSRFLEKGYETTTIAVRNHDRGQREARQGPPIGFYGIGAGAIHGIEINGEFQR